MAAYRLPAAVPVPQRSFTPRAWPVLQARSALGWCCGCALVIAALGCSPLRRVHECKRVIDAVNDGMSGLPAYADAGPNPATYTQLADAYDAIGKRLEGASSSDP